MSADLFAEFASPSSSASKPSLATQPQSNHPTKPAVDPFAFLFSPTSQTSSPQTFQSPAQPWPSIQPQQQNQQSGSNGWGNIGTYGAAASAPQQPAQQTTDDDDDGWGDFEEASSSTVANPPASMLSGHADFPGTTGGPRTQHDLPARTRILRADTFALMSNSLVGLNEAKGDFEPWNGRSSWEKTSVTSPGFTSQPTVPKPKRNNANPDVLFDADDFDEEPHDDDDEFGDFETVEAPSVNNKIPAPAPASVPAKTAMADLLSLDFGPPAQAAPSRSHVPPPISTQKEPPSRSMSTLSLNAPVLSPNAQYPAAPRSPSFSDRNPFPGLAVTTPVPASMSPEMKVDVKEQEATPVTAWPGVEPAEEKDDYFDAFADFPLDASSATPGAVSSSWDWDTVEAPESQIPPRRSVKSSPHKIPAEEAIGLPPTNVPPPSILLSIFTEMLEEADTKLYKPTANQAPGVKSRIYADPATLDYLRGYLILSTVAARILAGRKLRWHRDKFLSQAMTISAAGGAKGGMKLAGIDKTQAAREDREAADVVGVWRDHVGKLRSAVAAANIGIQKQPMKLEPLHVPEINDHMIVSAAKMALTAPRVCVVCGLKRDERVKGVDVVVEDSFGEWWIEHWGHRTCRSFWLGNEEKLRSR